MASAAELVVKIGADIKGLLGGFSQAAEAAQKVNQNLKDTFLGNVGANLATAALQGLANQAMGAVHALAEVSKINAQTEAVITSTGGAANVTAQQIASFADQMERKTGIEAEAIQSGQNLLLTFTGIRNEAGAGNDIFNQTSSLMADLATVMGTDTKGAALQLGKAINDPAQGMTALSRAGISFTDGQKATIKSLQDSGDLMGAQKIILAELRKEVGGSAEAFGGTFAGALLKAGNGLGAIFEAMAAPSLPFFTNTLNLAAKAAYSVADALTARGLGGALEQVTQLINQAFGPTAKALVIGFGSVITGLMIPSIMGIVTAFGAAVAAAAPLILLGGAIAALAYPIIKNWDFISEAIGRAMTTGKNQLIGLYNKAASVFSRIGQIVSDAMMYAGLIIRETFGDKIADALGAGVSSLAGRFKTFQAMTYESFSGVSSFASTVGANIRENWGDMFSDIRAQVSSLTRETKVSLKTPAASAAVAAGGMGDPKSAEKARKEAEKLAKEMERQEQATIKAGIAYAKKTAALYELGLRMKQVSEQAAALGNTFDESGARAEAIKGVIGQLKSAFGQFSPTVLQLEANMRRYEAASKNGGAASAEAYSIIKDGADQLDQARHKAGLLGETWSEAGEQIKQFQNDLDQLYQKGIKPGNAIYDEHKKKLDNVIESQKKIPPTTEEIQKVFTDLTSSFAAVITGLAGIAEGLGFGVPDSVRTMATAVYQGVQTMMGLISAFDSAGKAITAFNSLMSTNPWLVAAGVAAAVLVAIGTAIYENFRKTEDEIKKRMASIEQSIEGSIVSALREGAMAFIAGASNYADIMRQKLRDGILQGVLQALISEDIIKQFKDLTIQIRDAYLSGNMEGFESLARQLEERATGVLNGLTPVLERVSGGLRAIAPEAAQTLNKAADEARATAAAKEASRKVTAADINPAGVAAIQKAIEIALNEGTEASRARAEELLRQLRIMQDREKVYRLQPLPGMALGGLVTGPTVARMGEGGRDEAVLPLTDRVFRNIAEGIAGAGASGAQVVINYTGSGKWTREDAQGLGRLLVSELRAMGIRA